MHDLDWTTIKDIFADALEQPEVSRDDFVRERSNGSEPLYNEVVSLLRSAEQPGDIIESNSIDLVSKVVGETENYTERHFGIYRIIRELGTGGMGSVFLAERDDGEFTMQVALKIVRASVADRVTTESFRQERQILARLHHPNIAVLHDGGVNEKGEPYLAMEFIDGEALTDYCDHHDLSIGERLAIFLKVCSAVAYAHRNLVVHRDIKPSNILIGDDGEPKLLDFGLAKVFDSSGQNTHTILRAFTPGYASPEQIRGESITTASDVYSLGVVLYELLTGVKPLSIEDKSYEEIVSTISGVEPLPPSQAASIEPGVRSSLQSLRGDLDNIALNALNKEPDRRYRSVEAFAGDIESYLKGYPVSARPKTFSYWASKFLKRNKVAAIATSLIIVTFLAGLTISYRQYRETESQKNRAEDVKGFLEKMLLSAVPDGSSGANQVFDPSINKMLEQAAAGLESEELSNQPEVKAELQFLIGEIYLRQGQMEPSLNFLRAALATATGAGSKNELLTLRIRGRIGSTESGRANYAEARAYFEQSIPGLRAAYSAGQIDAGELIGFLDDYGILRRALGDSEAGETIFRETLDIAAANALSPESTRNTRNFLALTLADQGKFDEAQVISEGLVAGGRLHGERTVALANSLTFLGIVCMEKGDLSRARASLREGEAIYRTFYSADSRFVFDNLRLQAEVDYLSGEYAVAGKTLDRVLENYRVTANPKFNSFGTALTLKGLILAKTGRYTEAEEILREAVRLRNENLPQGYFMTAVTEGALGEVLLASGKTAEAAILLQRSFDSLTLTQEPGSPRVSLARTRLERLNAAEQSQKQR